MREYNPKKDLQKKVYYNDRFYVSNESLKLEVQSDDLFLEDLDALKNRFNVENSYIEFGHLVIYISSNDNVKVLKFLKDELNYDMLMELSCIDYIEKKDGFEVFYELISMNKKKRVRVKCFIKINQNLSSVEQVFKMANWSEREMYDMYGVNIVNHHNLKRILMPFDWYGHPLLKSYPLQGDEVAQWYEVDTIFGKENREIIGEEIRDSAFIDRYDTTRFSRLGHEVPFGVDITNGKEPKHTPIRYQEETDRELFGLKVIKKLDENETEHLDKRR